MTPISALKKVSTAHLCCFRSRIFNSCFLFAALLSDFTIHFICQYRHILTNFLVCYAGIQLCVKGVTLTIF